MIELDPGPDQVIGPKELGRRFGRGHKWARALLREWWDEQQRGGPARVFPMRGRGGFVTYYTTIAVVHRHMPPGRDEKLVRAVKEHDRDLDQLARKIDRLMDLNRTLEKRVVELEKRR